MGRCYNYVNMQMKQPFLDAIDNQTTTPSLVP